MKDTLHFFFMGFFAVIALFILFVGKNGNGGKQTASVVQQAGSSLSGLASSLETGVA